jgi:hypothetical protein
MKKLIMTILAGTLLITGLSAKTWTNNIGLGLTVPLSGTKVKDGNDIFQVGYGVKGSYLGFHENGFTVRAEETLAIATSKDIKVQTEDTNIGIIGISDIGLGYSFVRTEKATVSLLGMLGLDLSVYEGSVTTFGTTVKNTCVPVLFNLGADIYAAYYVKENFGIFADVSARWLVGGAYLLNTSTERGSSTISTTNTSDLQGKFRIQPSFGIVWNF